MPDRWGAPKEDLVREALRTVMEHASGRTAEYAKVYANAGLELGMTGEELRVQVLYVLSNLVYWRGELAREVKSTLKGEYQL